MKRYAPAVLVALALLFAFSHTWAAKLYKWVDDEGNVHYSDKLPPAAAPKARIELNKRGMQVEEVEAQKTPEELAHARELERLMKEQERLIEQQKEDDLVLLNTFQSADDIVMARDGKTAALDILIQVTRGNIKRQKIRLEEMQETAANRERSGKGISSRYLEDIESLRRQLKQNYESIIELEKRKEAVRQKFNADLVRFRSLKKLHQPEETVDMDKIRDSILLTVYECTGQDCERAWTLAQEYTRKNATTRIQMLGKNIIMTARPLDDKDVSITVSRILPKVSNEENIDDPITEIFMDVQCKESPLGREHCKTDTVEKIRTGFRGYLGASQVQR